MYYNPTYNADLNTVIIPTTPLSTNYLRVTIL